MRITTHDQPLPELRGLVDAGLENDKRHAAPLVPVRPLGCSVSP